MHNIPVRYLKGWFILRMEEKELHLRFGNGVIFNLISSDFPKNFYGIKIKDPKQRNSILTKNWPYEFCMIKVKIKGEWNSARENVWINE